MNLHGISDDLEKVGYCVCPDFLDEALLSGACLDFEKIQQDGEFHQAGIGQKHLHRIESQTRGDQTFWFDRASCNVAQGQLLDQIDLLKFEFNHKLFLNLQEFEGHYASYSAGGYYHRHLDSFDRHNARRVSVIMYLNQNWHQGDGGELRIYHDGTHLDISPSGGTMVCFLSQEFEHEVLTSFVDRHSFTGWLKTRQD